MKTISVILTNGENISITGVTDFHTSTDVISIEAAGVEFRKYYYQFYTRNIAGYCELDVKDM